MMGINMFPTEPLSLHKLNGEVFDNIEALVDEGEIHIDDVSIPIEEDDYLVRTLPNGSKEYYKVTDRGFYKGDGINFPDNYQVKVTRTSEAEMDRNIRSAKALSMVPPHKVFISHSSKDKEYMVAFVELLEDIGMPDGSIVCSSVPGHGIPGGEKTFAWLREQFLQCDLRMVFALSHNYYDSPASLNEMGAAWLTKATDTLLLLPGFNFNEIKGCIDPTEIGIKLDSAEDELKHRLGEFKDTLLSEYSLPMLSGSRWERHRDEFIRKVHEIALSIAEQQKAENETETAKTGALGVVASSDFPNYVPTEAAFLLVYAAEDNGEILKSNSISEGESISAAGKQFMANSSAREVARWDEALDFLIKQVWVKPAGVKGVVFKVTGTGYHVADMLKENMGIDTSKEPLEELKEFEE